ncbi:Uncharacterised protein [Bordetella ansorpii]|uniref:Alpha/beta hydrolase domain-containing protein n=1 Tax=Bordetella ansorpii TaxID=288768 RepID=A0A157SWI5_9BORD|nr:alpha/beta hydrolase domain-containing protein [Bordetella ansorpii]SAI74807.1 Uncharacterised protein [Bordetella ansorpii]
MLAAGDQRLSLEERYGDHDGYVRAVEDGAQALMRDRLLLREDAEAAIEAARASTVLRAP